MNMPDFIEQNLDPILDEWKEFAKQQRPAAQGMTERQLRNFGLEMLQSIARDMRVEQTEKERHAKSRGRSPDSQPEEVADSARRHAADRLVQGFTLNQLVAEYRALRASVIRRWRAVDGASGDEAIEELTRFNEAVDESQAEAVGWYHARVEDARDLLNGALAHDLRNPLQAILVSAEALLQDETLNPEQMRTAIRMRNSGKRLRQMISDLLDFTLTRLGTGMPLTPTANNMAALIRRVCVEQKAFRPRSRIQFNSSGDLIGLWDGERMLQLLTNLVNNALEHGDDSPVSITATGRDDQVKIEVHNGGSVITEQEQQVIFDPLRRVGTHPKENHGAAGVGVGLGLYIARQIAEAHGGSIEVSSSEEAGTTFEVRLPRQTREGANKAGLT